MKKRDFSPLRTMSSIGSRLLKLCLLWIFSLSSLVIQAQDAQRISVDLRGETLEAALWYLQNKTKFVFMYAAKDIANVSDINVAVKNKTVIEIVEKCLEGTDLTFEVKGNAIVIKKLERPLVTVSGWVRDSDGEALVGATVMIRGSKKGAIVGFDGRYTLKVPDQPGLVLTYSFIGMEKKEIRYNGKKTLNVTLTSNNTEIEEVVVTGYQNIKRRDLVGSITTIKADDILMPSFTTIDQMLQGRVAGMIVTNSSSRVGTAPKIQIRGTSTLLGNTSPLWVVDGIIQEDPLELNSSNLMTQDLETIIGNQVSWLNPADIENISILKDASATAIYGSKASNGVIEITTKKNTTDRLMVNYSANLSIGSRPNYGMFDLMNSQERIQLSQEAFNAGVAYRFVPFKQIHNYEGLLRMYLEHDISNEEYQSHLQQLETRNTDWFDLLTRRSFSHNHSVSISGGTHKYNYSVSMGYNNSEGQEIGNNSERLTGRISLTLRPIQKLTINASINGSVSTNKGFAGGVDPMSYATNTNRAIAPDAFYQIQAGYTYNENVKSLSYNFMNERDNSGAKSKSSYMSAALDVQWKILDWLSYEFTGGYTANNNNSESWMGERTFYIAEAYRGYDYNSVSPTSPEFKAAMLPFGGELFTSNAQQNSYNIQNKLQISKAFDSENRLNALLGMEVRSADKQTLGNTVWGYVPERGETIIRPTTPEEFAPISGGNISGWGILNNMYRGRWKKTAQTDNFISVFATFAYSFKNRYVLNANIRNDWSNRFGQDTKHRLDPTYSFGLSWRASEEKFMKEYLPWISSLNLRATYGIQGNALTRESPDLILTQGGIANVYNQYESNISQIPNPLLTWERTKTWNFGIDWGLFNKFHMNLEYYTRRSNAIISVPLPFEYGVSSMKQNGGIIYNRGVEYTLSFSPIQKRDYTLNISLNASKNWNKAGGSQLDLKKVSDLKQQYLSGRSDIMLKEGYPIGAFWSYSFAGLNPENGEAMFNLLDIPEDQRNAKIDPTTFLVYSGQTEPFFTGGLSLGFRYKSLTLNTSFSLLLGGKKRLTSPYSQFGSSIYMPDSENNLSRELINRWKQPGDEAHTIIPSLPFAGEIITLPDKTTATNKIPLWEKSDAMVVNSTFLRCRNLSLSWQMKPEWCEKIHAKNLSLSFNVDNLFVIADKRFNGFDPELGNSVMPHTYSLGLNVSF